MRNIRSARITETVSTERSASAVSSKQDALAWIPMAGQLIGAAVGVGALAAIAYCSRSRPKGMDAVDEVGGGRVTTLSTPDDLDSIFASGSKAVVYLTASW